MTDSQNGRSVVSCGAPFPADALVSAVRRRAFRNIVPAWARLLRSCRDATEAMEQLSAAFVRSAVRFELRKSARRTRGQRIRDRRAQACRLAIEGLQRRGAI